MKKSILKYTHLTFPIMETSILVPVKVEVKTESTTTTYATVKELSPTPVVKDEKGLSSRNENEHVPAYKQEEIKIISPSPTVPLPVVKFI